MGGGLGDSFARVCLEKTGRCKKASLGFGNKIGRYFESTEHPIVCDEGPCDMSHPLNAQSFCNATKSEMQGRCFDRVDKVAAMRGDGDAGTRVPNHREGGVFQLVGVRRRDKGSKQGLCSGLEMVGKVSGCQKRSDQGWRT